MNSALQLLHLDKPAYYDLINSKNTHIKILQGHLKFKKRIYKFKFIKDL